MRNFNNKFKKGQSLVELALFLPLFLVIVGGLVELGQFLVIKNRVDTAANLAARFGAQGGENDGMANVAINSITQTLTVDENNWDIWAFRGQVNSLGTEIDASTFEFEHVYGNELTNLYPEFAGQDVTLRSAIYDELVSTEVEGGTDQERIQDVEFAGTLVIYDADSILNLDTVLGDVYSVQALHVQRTFPTSSSTNGCDSFPIVIRKGSRSLTEAEFNEKFASNQSTPEYLSPDGFKLEEGKIMLAPEDIGNASALPEEGNVFLFEDAEGGTNQMSWVRWNTYSNTSQGNLTDNLTWPGRSTDYEPPGATGSAHPVYGYAPYGYIEPGDDSDESLHVGDWIAATTGAKASNGEDLDPHIEKGRTLRFTVYDDTDNFGNGQGAGSTVIYRAYGFVILRIIGYQLSNSAGGSWVMVEFIRWDDTCGQTTDAVFGN